MVVVLRLMVVGILVPLVPCFQGRSDSAVTFSSEKVMSRLLLEVQEDGLDECRLVQIAAVIGQRGQCSRDLFDGW